MGRFNGGEYSDYWISSKQQEAIPFTVYSNPKTIKMDFFCGEDMVILKKYEVEKCLGIVLKPLEQIKL